MIPYNELVPGQRVWWCHIVPTDDKRFTFSWDTPPKEVKVVHRAGKLYVHAVSGFLHRNSRSFPVSLWVEAVLFRTYEEALGYWNRTIHEEMDRLQEYIDTEAIKNLKKMEKLKSKLRKS